MLIARPGDLFRCMTAIAVLASGAISPAVAQASDRLTLDQVQSYVYAIASDSLNQPLQAIGTSRPDMVITGGGFSDPPPDRSALDPSGTKLVIGYLALSEATDWAYPQFVSGGSVPSWFGRPLPGWPAEWSVQFWNPEWRAAIFANIDTIIAHGWDGVFFDTASGGGWLDGNPYGNPVYPGATEAMATLLRDVTAYIRAKNLASPFYLIANNPEDVARHYPDALKGLDAIFVECAYYAHQSGANPPISEYKGLGTTQLITTVLAPIYRNLGVRVLGNDYPPLTDANAIFDSFAYYSALGWTPSVNQAFQTPAILSTGPFLLMATPGRPLVTGAQSVRSYLSGGTVPTATLIGGAAGDYFLGGPGTNTIQGGAGDDTIYAHPANARDKDVLALSFYAHNTVGVSPRVTVMINGVKVVSDLAITALEATGAEGQVTQDVRLNTKQYGPITSVEIAAADLSYIDANHYSNVYVSSILLHGIPISFHAATYAGYAYDMFNGSAAQLNSGGRVTFAESAFPASPFLADTRDSIDGGGGYNTVVFRGTSNQYSVSRLSDGALVVTALETAEGPDTVRNVQMLQFADGQAHPLYRGWNLLGNATTSILNASALFADASPVVSVWKWSAVGQRWSLYSPTISPTQLRAYAAASGYDVLESIAAGEGFWVNASSDGLLMMPGGAPFAISSLPPSTAAGGWHLRAVADTIDPARVANAVGSSVRAIWAWNAIRQQWMFYAPELQAQGGSALSDYIQAHGYLDFRAANSSFGYGVGFWIQMR